MADKLVFPIQFDIEGGLEDAISKSDGALDKLQKHLSRAMKIKVGIDDKDALDEIDKLTKRLDELQKKFENLGKTGGSSIGSDLSNASAQATALSAELTNIVDKLIKAGEATQDQLEKLKESTDEAAKLSAAVSSATKPSSNATPSSTSSTATTTTTSTTDATAALIAMLNATENTIDNITKKLNHYNEQIKGLEVGTDQWNEAALNIRRLSDELDVANTRLKDFQQAAFKGLSDDLTKQQVEKLTQLRQQVAEIDTYLNERRANNTLYDANGELNFSITQELEKRKRLTSEINEMIKTGAQMQLEYEKQISAEKERQRAAQLRMDPQGQVAQATTLNQMRDVQSALQAELGKVDKNTDPIVWNNLAQAIANVSQKIKETTEAAKLFSDESMAGLPDYVQQLQAADITNLRQQLEQLDQLFNQLRASNQALDASGNLTDAAKQILDQRIQLLKKLKEETLTAAQAQKEYERQLKSTGSTSTSTGQKNKQAIQAALDSVKDLTERLKKAKEQLNTLKPDNTLNSQFQQTAKAVKQLSEQLSEAKAKTAALTGEAKAGYSSQTTYLGRLVRRMALYFSLQQVGNFLTTIREVTAEFELQRTSLGAILQNQQKADVLFSQIKSLAIESPVKLMDLTKYVKQVAAYRIEYDKLFDTTKRLTDVSVGLGVSMDRIVLMYGQVRAAGYLRASELRQATEAGIPLLELLAEKISQLQNRLVSTADVMSMIQNRMIDFKMVEQVFEEMTDAGGIFYNMQEKQAETLYGMWAKLGDAASIMYDKLGQDPFINWSLKTTVGLISRMLKDFQYTIRVFGALAAAIAILVIKQRLQAVTSKGMTAANTRLTEATMRLTLAEERAAATTNKWKLAFSQLNLAAARASLAAANASRAAATATGVFQAAVLRLRSALLSLKAFFLSNFWTIAIFALAEITALVINYFQEQDKYTAKIDEMTSRASQAVAEATEKFKNLVEAAVNAADGSVEQAQAMEELKRTYGEMLPVQDLTIDKLKEMNGQYDNLTRAVQEYTLAKQREKDIEDTRSTWAEKLKDAEKQVRNAIPFPESLWLKIKTRLTALFEAGYRTSQDAEKYLDLFDFMNKYGLGYLVRYIGTEKTTKAQNEAFMEYIKTLEDYYEQIDNINNAYKNLGEIFYPSQWNNARKQNEDYGKQFNGFMRSQVVLEKNIRSIVDLIKKDFEDYNNALTDGAQQISWNDAWFVGEDDYEDMLKNNKYFEQATIDFDAILDSITDPTLKQKIIEWKQIYEGLIPNNKIARLFKDHLREMASSAKVSMDHLVYILWDGNSSIKDYYDNLVKQVNDLKQAIHERETALVYKTDAPMITGETLEEAKKRLALMEPFAEYVKEFLLLLDGAGGGADQSLQKLLEIERALSEMYKKYGQLSDQQGKIFADSEIITLYADQIKYLNGIAKEFNLPDFEIPTTLEQLNQYRRRIREVIETLENEGKEKAALDIEMHIGTAVVDDLINMLKEELDKVAEELRRQRVIDDFYNKIVQATKGDYPFARFLTDAIFEDTGFDARTLLKKKVETLFTNAGIDLSKLNTAFFNNGLEIDFRELLIIADREKENLGAAYKEIVDIVNEGQKNLAQTYQQYIKDLEKAETYSQRLVDLTRYTNQQIAKITNDPRLNTPDNTAFRDRLIAGYLERQRREEAKIEWNFFKDMPAYVTLFGDLENASRVALEDMRTRLLALKSTWGDALDPTALKEIQKQLSALDNQIAMKNPFKALRDSIRDYRKLGSRAAAEQALVDATAKQVQETNNLRDALEQENQAREKYEKLLATEGSDSWNTQAALEELDMRQKATSEAQKRLDAANKEVTAAQEVLDKHKRIKDLMIEAAEATLAWGDTVSKLGHSIASVVEIFGASEEDVQYFQDIADGFDMVLSGITDITTAAVKGDLKGIIDGALTAIPNLIGGFVKLFNAGKIRAANKEIAKQEKALKQLEYTYDRLQAAADKLFGTDYISNYNRQMAILQAQQAAYLAQAEAERSKGKAKDQNAIDGYLEKAREVGDQIADMQDQLAQKFTDTTMTDAAKDFATAWLEAKASFASTTTAIKEKYRDLIKNLIIEGAAAKVIENALQPMWDKLNELLKGGDVTGAMQWLSQSMDSFVQQANDGMTVLWNSLEQAGIDVQKAFNGDSGVTGISREIASASEESINGLAQGINTQNYYISFVPQIAQEVAAIRVALQGGGQASGAAAGWTDWQTQAMGHYAEIQRNTAETALRCEKAASACQEVADRLRRVVESKKSAIRTTIV